MLITEANNIKAWNEFTHLGNEEAFHVLYTYYYKYLTYVGMKKGFSYNFIKDGINDLFLYLWENKEKLKVVLNFHNYLTTIFLRKLYKKDEFTTEENAELDTYPETLFQSSVEIQYINTEARHEVSRVLKNFVEKLPERQRLMIYQKFYLNMSYKEIAELNNVSINTVYNTIYKALEKLKSQIGEDSFHSISLAFLMVYFLYLFFYKQ